MNDEEMERFTRLAQEKGLALILLEYLSHVNDRRLTSRLTKLFRRTKVQIRRDFPPYSIEAEIFADYADAILTELENEQKGEKL